MTRGARGRARPGHGGASPPWPASCAPRSLAVIGPGGSTARRRGRGAPTGCRRGGDRRPTLGSFRGAVVLLSPAHDRKWETSELKLGRSWRPPSGRTRWRTATSPTAPPTSTGVARPRSSSAPTPASAPACPAWSSSSPSTSRSAPIAASWRWSSCARRTSASRACGSTPSSRASCRCCWRGGLNILLDGPQWMRPRRCWRAPSPPRWGWSFVFFHCGAVVDPGDFWPLQCGRRREGSRSPTS